MVAPSRRFIVLSGYDRRRQASIARASERLDLAAGELEAARSPSTSAHSRYGEALRQYLAEYRRFLRVVTQAKKAGVPASRVARWAGMSKVSIWRLMTNPHVPSPHNGLPKLLRRTRPPGD